MTEAPTTCPKCGHLNTGAAMDCENCGITFAIYDPGRQAAEDRQEDPGKIAKAEKPAPAMQTLECPNCGSSVRADLEECLSCGVIFAKAFEIREKELADAPEKLSALKELHLRHRKALADRRQKEEAEKAEQLRRRKEQEENLRRKKEEQRQAEALQRQQTLAEKAEGLRLQIAQIETQMALDLQAEELAGRERAVRQQAEAEKNKALQRQAEAFEKEMADLQKELKREFAAALEQHKVELEKKRQTYLQAVEAKKSEALARQQESFAKAQETWRQEADAEQSQALEAQKLDFDQARAQWLAEAEAAKQAVLASQQAQLEAEKAAFQRQIESEVSQALAQQRDEMQAALAIERQQIHDRKSQARRRQEADLARNRALAEAVTLQTVVEPQTTLQALLKKVEGQTIGINYPDGGSTRKAILLHVGEDYFSVYNGIDGLNYSYPLKTIASVVQSMDGIHTQDESDATEVFLLLQLSIQLSPL